jgi:hypothetical protein
VASLAKLYDELGGQALGRDESLTLLAGFLDNAR